MAHDADLAAIERFQRIPLPDFVRLERVRIVMAGPRHAEGNAWRAPGPSPTWTLVRTDFSVVHLARERVASIVPVSFEDEMRYTSGPKIRDLDAEIAGELEAALSGLGEKDLLDADTSQQARGQSRYR